VSFSPNGAHLASGGADGSVNLWDLRNGTCERRLKGHAGYVLSLTYSPDGTLLASGGQDRTVRCWSTDGDCLSTLGCLDGPVLSITFGSHSKRLMLGMHRGRVELDAQPSVRREG
jgi:WD40 repeat protein